MAFCKNDIRIDPRAETELIIDSLRRIVGRDLHKRGGVIGISGGIDSSVCLALSEKAFGSERVLGVTMPEADSNPISTLLTRKLARHFKIEYVVEDMTAALSGFGTHGPRRCSSVAAARSARP